MLIAVSCERQVFRERCLRWRVDGRNAMMTYDGVEEDFLCRDWTWELSSRGGYHSWCGAFDVKLGQVNYTASGTKLRPRLVAFIMAIIDHRTPFGFFLMAIMDRLQNTPFLLRPIILSIHKLLNIPTLQILPSIPGITIQLSTNSNPHKCLNWKVC